MNTKNLLKHLCKAKNIAYLVLDSDFKHTCCNDLFLKYFSLDNSDQAINTFINKKLYDRLTKHRLNSNIHHFKRKILTNNNPKWVEFTLKMVANEIIVIAEDITTEKYEDENLRYLANIDSLTSLANRTKYSEHMDEAYSRCLRNKLSLTIVMIDLDGFKPINDNHGHDAGDFILKTVSEHLVSCTRDIDLVSRLGGDEFSIILEAIENRDDLIHLGERILTISTRNIIYNNIQLNVSCSVGIFLCQDVSRMNTMDIIKQADIAMYKAKNSGKNQYHIQLNKEN